MWEFVWLRRKSNKLLVRTLKPHFPKYEPSMTDLNQKVRELEFWNALAWTSGLILVCPCLFYQIIFCYFVLILLWLMILAFASHLEVSSFQFFFCISYKLVSATWFYVIESLALWQEDGIWITVLPSDADQIVICL